MCIAISNETACFYLTLDSLKLIHHLHNITFLDPCKELNGKYGGCDQVCIAISNETTCLCDVGFKLNADGKKCDSAYRE